jgi:hypothetical protein
VPAAGWLLKRIEDKRKPAANSGKFRGIDCVKHHAIELHELFLMLI